MIIRMITAMKQCWSQYASLRLIYSFLTKFRIVSKINYLIYTDEEKEQANASMRNGRQFT